MSRISNSTVHTPRDPENLEESYHRFLGVAADRAGQDVGGHRKNRWNLRYASWFTGRKPDIKRLKAL